MFSSSNSAWRLSGNTIVTRQTNVRLRLGLIFDGDKKESCMFLLYIQKMTSALARQTRQALNGSLRARR
jgi:hypothetical protein